VYVKLWKDRYNTAKTNFKDRFDRGQLRNRARIRYLNAKGKLQDRATIRYYNAKIKLKDKYHSAKEKLRDRYHTAKSRARSRLSLQGMYYPHAKWTASSRSIRNRVVLRTRIYADRFQRAWNRSLVNVTTKYLLKMKPTTMRRMQFLVPIQLKEYSEDSWFCEMTGRPLTSRDATGRFVNPWLSQSTDGVKSAWQVLLWRWERFRRMCHDGWIKLVAPTWFGQTTASSTHPNVPSKDSTATLPLLPNATISDAYSLMMNSTELSSFDNVIQQDRLQLTWIGHSTCLIQQGNIRILTDPIFSTRCSPFQNIPIGVARDVEPALSISELPDRIDVCLISHDHYDHLDKDSVVALQEKVDLWAVPLGIKSWMLERTPVQEHQIVELEWWESIKLCRDATDDRSNSSNRWSIVRRHSAAETGASTHPALFDTDVLYATTNNHEKNQTMWISCLPAQHWASRTFFDRNFRLWCSFGVFLPGSKFFFGGDTALPEHFPLFSQVRNYLGGNVDLAALPIGAYEPAFFMQDAHMNPEEAVRVHQMLNAKQSVGIHWGCFALSEEPMDEPPVRLHRAVSKAQVNFCTLRNGQTISVQCRIVPEAVSEQESIESSNAFVG
jgi:N-acyl-phosphatidylethanolamine-hydrolysing phospholipase D